MKRFLIVLILLPLLSFTGLHKYYVSVTEIEYVSEKQSVQIITRIFVDDFERLIQERYDESITLADIDEPKVVDLYIERYLTEKIRIKINEQSADLLFIGKEYDRDILKCYLEIEGVGNIQAIEISNKVLFDLFEDQQNIIKTNINSKKKSYILLSQDETALLKFN